MSLTAYILPIKLAQLGRSYKLAGQQTAIQFRDPGSSTVARACTLPLIRQQLTRHKRPSHRLALPQRLVPAFSGNQAARLNSVFRWGKAGYARTEGR